MIIGIPKEIMNDEARVAATPDSVKKYVADGHKVLVEVNAGIGAQCLNEAYAAASSYGIDNTVVISWGLPFACVMLSQETELDIAGMKQASGLNMSKALETAIMLSGPDQMA